MSREGYCASTRRSRRRTDQCAVSEKSCHAASPQRSGLWVSCCQRIQALRRVENLTWRLALITWHLEIPIRRAKVIQDPRADNGSTLWVTRGQMMMDVDARQ